MKSTLRPAALVVLVAVVGTCLGMISVENVSKDRAKKLGVELRGIANGPKEAWIEMEFKTEGELKEFKHVSLEIRDAEQFQLGWTPLQATRTDRGSVVVRLMGNRAFLEKVTLRVVVGALGEEGHDLQVKDFVDLKNLR